MKAQLILELRISTEFAIAKNFTETLNKTKKGVCGSKVTKEASYLDSES
jgi:hypothetical protein